MALTQARLLYIGLMASKCLAILRFCNAISSLFFFLIALFRLQYRMTTRQYSEF